MLELLECCCYYYYYYYADKLLALSRDLRLGLHENFRCSRSERQILADVGAFRRGIACGPNHRVVKIYKDTDSFIKYIQVSKQNRGLSRKSSASLELKEGK